MTLQIVRRLTQQYPAKHYPVIDNQLTAIHECLRAYCMPHSAPLLGEPVPAETSPGPEKATGTRRCSICSHPDREDIDSALRGGASLRAVAGRFGASKSALARHHRHMEQSNHEGT